jgi:hypothetical protein
MQTIERENRQNGNEKGSEKGSEKGTREEGCKEGCCKEEVKAVNHQQGNTQKGDAQSVPLSVCRQGINLMGRQPADAFLWNRWKCTGRKPHS